MEEESLTNEKHNAVDLTLHDRVLVIGPDAWGLLNDLFNSGGYFIDKKTGDKYTAVLSDSTTATFNNRVLIQASVEVTREELPKLEERILE